MDVGWLFVRAGHGGSKLPRSMGRWDFEGLLGLRLLAAAFAPLGRAGGNGECGRRATGGFRWLNAFGDDGSRGRSPHQFPPVPTSSYQSLPLPAGMGLDSELAFESIDAIFRVCLPRL